MAFLLDTESISRVAVELLARQLVLAGTVTRIPGTEFSGPSGGTTTLRVPVLRTARVQATPGTTITFDPVTEVGVPVTVKHIYDAARLTDEDLSLRLEDFGRQVLNPQTESVARRGELELAAVMNALPADLELPADPVSLDDAEWPRVFEDRLLEAGEILDSHDVPAGDRYLAVSPSVARRAMRLDRLVTVSGAGDASRLRDATLGVLLGFTVVKSTALTAGTAVAYHSSGLAFGTLAPTAPAGAAASSSSASGGVALRHIRQYDATTLSDQSVVSTFVGAGLVDADRVVKLGTADESS